MDAFKKETAVGFTVYDIKAKPARNKSRVKDAKMVKRSARRKFKNFLKKALTDPQMDDII